MTFPSLRTRTAGIPQMGRAVLAAIHHNIGSPWSARSPLNCKFRCRAAPSWIASRKRHAADPLILPCGAAAKLGWSLGARKTMAQSAQEVGYGSEEAFSRAFKRKFGPPPRAGGTGSRRIDAACA